MRIEAVRTAVTTGVAAAVLAAGFVVAQRALPADRALAEAQRGPAPAYTDRTG
ncbi:hypothetical protein IU436_08050 [Nocardia farcinica]|uniref:hypothetical protein n=1 Tax=Nocardia farcinica TaxID=37329 RepID=UPI0018930DD2|nr:hypothetical protein [Nocardia farcinica]MBF6418822.1 hypothetical protein [Nocardia farcinica]MBF6430299.1 hypothetical protein [Nocardia farcinica]MBF6500539.1 hypothetical protein [Nocardia farcinica]